jgi:hypothetical protein
MAFSTQSKKTGETYFLHSKEVTLRGGRKQRIFYFGREQKDNACDMPEGYLVMENSRTGLPMLKKDK